MNNTQNKLNLYEPKSKLAFAETLSDELLSEVTPTDLITYEREFKILNEKKAEDLTLAQERIETLRMALSQTFGSDSRQLKYIDRELTKGDTVVDRHYSRFSEPKAVETKVESAGLKVGKDSVRAGLSETNVDELNDAIEYLTKNGYVFGRDFNAHNAVDMAKVGYVEECREKPEKVRFSDEIERCGECETDITSEHLDLSQFHLSCRCYEDRIVNVIFEDKLPVYGVVTDE